MQADTDTGRMERLANPLPLGMADHVEMIDVPALLPLDRSGHDARQPLVVQGGDAPALVVPFVQMPQLDPQRRGLQGV